MCRRLSVTETSGSSSHKHTYTPIHPIVTYCSFRLSSWGAFRVFLEPDSLYLCVASIAGHVCLFHFARLAVKSNGRAGPGSPWVKERRARGHFGEAEPTVDVQWRGQGDYHWPCPTRLNWFQRAKQWFYLLPFSHLNAWLSPQEMGKIWLEPGCFNTCLLFAFLSLKIGFL